MKLTCVTATFNALAAGNRDRLLACIRSVAALKIPHEHLIYDGASTDGTVDLLSELARSISGLKVVSEPDTGIYNALNKGVRDAQGEWFYVLGCDDVITDPAEVDRVLAAEDAGTQAIVAAVDGGPTVDWAPTPRQDLWKTLLSTPYCHQCLFLRTAVVRSFGGFDERFRLCADYDMILKAHLAALRFHFVDGTIARYNPDGASSSFEETEREICHIHQERLGLSRDQSVRYRQRRFPPLGFCLRFCWHRDLGVRTSARFMLGRWLRHYRNMVIRAMGGFALYHATRRKMGLE